MSGDSLVGGIGRFWLPAEPDDQIAGHLTWDDETGATVTLLGAFRFTEDVGWDADVVLGRVGTREFTVQGCDASVRSTWGRRSAVETTVLGRAVLDGVHLVGVADDARFRGTTFRVANADDWLDRNGPSLEHLPRGIRFAYEAEPDETWGPWALKAGFTFSPTYQPTSLRLDRQLSYRFVPEPDVALAEALEAVRSIESLTSLATGEQQEATHIVLGHPTDDVRTGPETTAPGPVRLYRRREQMARQGQRTRRAPLFQLPDLGGLAGLAEWHNRHTVMRSVAALLGAVQGGHLPYLENEFLTSALAAELLDRHEFPNALKEPSDFRVVLERVLAAVDESDRDLVHSSLRYANEPRLSDRLRRLAERVNFDGVVLPVRAGRWAQAVAQCRNRLTHDSGLCDEDRADAVHWLSQCLWWITAANLLEPISQQATRRLLAGREATHAFSQLQSSLSVIEPYLQRGS